MVMQGKQNIYAQAPVIFVYELEICILFVAVKKKELVQDCNSLIGWHVTKQNQIK
jgi:hypothetical protein